VNVQHLQIATLTLSGKRPVEIAAAAGITTEALSAIRQNKSYKRVEARLAGQMLDAAGASLQSMAVEAVEKLRSILKIPIRNLRGQNGLERKIGDPALLKEQRLSAVAILQISALLAEKEADLRESKALDRQLSRDVDDD
jgi:hypothetical protein